MPWMCGQLQVLRLDFKIGELVRHLAVNVTMPFRLLIFIYLISSAVIAFDQRRLPILETGLRIALAILVMVTVPGIHWTATVIALAYIAWHQFAYSRQAAPTTN